MGTDATVDTEARIDTTLEAGQPDLAELAAAAVHAHGYATVTGVLDAGQCAELVHEVSVTEGAHNINEGTNEFEGFATRRIFDLIGKSERFRELAINPVVLPIIDTILGEDPLLSGTTSMNIGPGETPQLLHTDDGMITLPRPHPPTMITTLWALSDFRADNGATCFVPGSHRFDRGPTRDDRPDLSTADMPAGSVLILHGSTWHGGGTNTTTDEHRFGLSVQYVAGWCRQQQNLMLGTERDVVATYPPRLQQLIGYSLYRNVMGHVNRENPATLLGADVPANMVWEQMNASDASSDATDSG